MGTCITESTSILLKTECGSTVISYKNDLFITRSHTSFTLAAWTLTLKKRFILSVRWPYQKRRLLFGLTQWFGKRPKKISSVYHYLTPSSIILTRFECDLNSSVNPSDLNVFPTAVFTFACGA